MKNILVSHDDEQEDIQSQHVTPIVEPKKAGMLPAIDDHRRGVAAQINRFEDVGGLEDEVDQTMKAVGTTSMTKIVVLDGENAEQESMLVHQGAYGKLKRETSHDADDPTEK